MRSGRATCHIARAQGTCLTAARTAFIAAYRSSLLRLSSTPRCHFGILGATMWQRALGLARISSWALSSRHRCAALPCPCPDLLHLLKLYTRAQGRAPGRGRRRRLTAKPAFAKDDEKRRGGPAIPAFRGERGYPSAQETDQGGEGDRLGHARPDRIPSRGLRRKREPGPRGRRHSLASTTRCAEGPTPVV